MVPSYKLSRDAQQDLRQVTSYTLTKWGEDAVHKYTSGLQDTFEAIGSGTVKKRTFSKTFPELLVTKYRFHYVFYLVEGLEKPGIIGVIHERRDITGRLNERLG
ncbi:MAG: type II toxin-antitoxin system RelE/ParE family toxin [Proteobacteria bacterium]|nr:type II toxin-antitoxin system RelE/ParE family toxin [Pseudomonadota bacterium]